MRHQHSRKRPENPPSRHQNLSYTKGLTLREMAALVAIEEWFREHHQTRRNRGNGKAAKEGGHDGNAA